MKNFKHTNALIHETSPYLLQHAHNPVNWRPYNLQTLQSAKDTKKLVIISIGYAACHWCHVMEHESFEDKEVAEVMNQYFIPVKVDREERPDVDQIYMNAVHLMTGSGGWPLNVVTLPDGRPIWGGTYFRKNDWINALEQLNELYQEEPEKLLAYANRLEEGIKNMDLVQLNEEDVDLKYFSTEAVVKKMSMSFDRDLGGAVGAPKFMMPSNLSFLMRFAIENNNDELLEYVFKTLEKMAYGGIYDQLGGGFSRYSTDVKWHVPHFEKMLYDNAQLVSLYSQAYAISPSQLYKDVVYETLEFVRRELTDISGGFYSALDADSINASGKLEEGAYYVYNKEELQELLLDDFNLFKEYYNINVYGKWEHNSYVLIRDQSDEEIEKQFNLTPNELLQKKKNWKKILLPYRQKRQPPRLDDKILTSWNGLMLKGYVDAYKAFGEINYLKIAIQNAEFIVKNLYREKGRLFHTYKNERSRINGFLEDYAFVIEAFIDLYEVTLDKKWLEYSNEMVEYTLTNFFDEKSHMFYFSSKEDPEIVTRNIEYRDNVIPASNSVMALNLFKLARHFDKDQYESISLQMLKNVLPEIGEYPPGFTNWLNLLLNFQKPFYEVVVVGPDAETTISRLNKHYLPNILVAGSKDKCEWPLIKNRFSKGSTLIYICKNNTCQIPVTDVEMAIKNLKDFE